jgi:hypothetical protein
MKKPNENEADSDRGFLMWIHERLEHVHGENHLLDYMHQLRAIIAEIPADRKTALGKPGTTENFLPSGEATCSPFQWPYSPGVRVGDVVADAGCMNARRWRDMKDIDQPPCPHRTVVAVFDWGLRVTDGLSESDVVDWFLPVLTR